MTVLQFVYKARGGLVGFSFVVFRPKKISFAKIRRLCMASPLGNARIRMRYVDCCLPHTHTHTVVREKRESISCQ